MLPPRPSTADISTYLSYHALHQLSGREYHEWVQAQADGGAAWAVEMLRSAQVRPESLSGSGTQSKLETENTENGAKLSSYEQFGFLIFTECRSLKSFAEHVFGD